MRHDRRDHHVGSPRGHRTEPACGNVEQRIAHRARESKRPRASRASPSRGANAMLAVPGMRGPTALHTAGRPRRPRGPGRGRSRVASPPRLTEAAVSTLSGSRTNEAPSAHESARRVQVLPDRGELTMRTRPAPGSLIAAARRLSPRLRANARKRCYGVGGEGQRRELRTIARDAADDQHEARTSSGSVIPPDPVPGVVMPWTPPTGVGELVAGRYRRRWDRCAVGVGVGVGSAWCTPYERLPTCPSTQRCSVAVLADGHRGQRLAIDEINLKAAVGHMHGERLRRCRKARIARRGGVGPDAVARAVEQVLL